MKRFNIKSTVLAVGLTIAISFSSLPANVHAAAKIKLNKKRLTMTVGKSQKLKVTAPKKAKITWKSNKKKIASVNAKGKVTARKVGKAKITATIKQKGKKAKKLTCQVTVKQKKVSSPDKTTIPAPQTTVKPVPTTNAPTKDPAPTVASTPGEGDGLYAHSPKGRAENNPLLTNSYACDPYAMEYDGRLYVYMTNDTQQYEATNREGANTYGHIQSMHIISTDDMVNWTDHGIYQISGENGVCSWAGCCWAPCAVHKTVDGKEKFYIYFTNGGWQIGVVAADSPTGPFVDVKGEALVTTDMTSSSPLDPAAFIDDDGTAYLTYGSGTDGARIRKLNADMISFAEEEVNIGAPYMNEDSGINKIGDTYYYSYCTDWDKHEDTDYCSIAYMTAPAATGPYTYQKAILPNCGTVFGVDGNNHHSIVEFQGKYYMFYHTMVLEADLNCDLGYRSTHVNELTINADGSINVVDQDRAGVNAIKNLNPYTQQSGCTYANSAGMLAEHMELVMIPKSSTAQDDATKAEYDELKKSYDTNPDYSRINISKGELKDDQVRKDNWFYFRLDNGARMEAVASPDDYRYSWSKVKNVDFGDTTPTTFEANFSCVPEQTAAIRVCADSLDGKIIAESEIIPDADGKATISVPADVITGIHDLYFEFDGSVYSFDDWKFLK
ncbi:MAG: family 43 glycosylhydrolase [Lachnospiraceae bacterium]|nr:family 43 glycosylhydrolase [Lachnospiraceae bacterium]